MTLRQIMQMFPNVCMEMIATVDGAELYEFEEGEYAFLTENKIYKVYVSLHRQNKIDTFSTKYGDNKIFITKEENKYFLYRHDEESFFDPFGDNEEGELCMPWLKGEIQFVQSFECISKEEGRKKMRFNAWRTQAMESFWENEEAKTEAQLMLSGQPCTTLTHYHKVSE